jgi:hypothetical protein
MTVIAKASGQAFQQPCAQRIQLFDTRDVDDNAAPDLLLKRRSVDELFQRPRMSGGPGPRRYKGRWFAAGGESESWLAHGLFLGRNIPQELMWINRKRLS